MNINDKSQIAKRRKDRPLGSSAFSTVRGHALGLALLALSAAPSYANGQSVLGTLNPGGKFSKDLQQQQSDANGMVTVIVQFQQMPNDAAINAIQAHGAKLKSKLKSIRALTLTVPVSMLADLANNPNVAYITPDRAVGVSSTTTTTYEEFATAVENDVAAFQFATAVENDVAASQF